MISTPSMRSIALLALGSLLLAGCAEAKKPYGVEGQLSVPGHRRQSWAVAPAINLSGQGHVDPLLQADLVYQELQQVHGLTVVPVNRVAEVYASMRIERVETAQEAALVCDFLGVDGLIVPTITVYDPYDPPKLGASLQLFTRPPSQGGTEGVDPRELSRAAAPQPGPQMPGTSGVKQAVGIFDATNGSVRAALYRYASGRNDPESPMGSREYLVSMDRYCGFVYHELICDLLGVSPPTPVLVEIQPE
jgi:hypothetical protein